MLSRVLIKDSPHGFNVNFLLFLTDLEERWDVLGWLQTWNILPAHLQDPQQSPHSLRQEAVNKVGLKFNINISIIDNFIFIRVLVRVVNVSIHGAEHWRLSVLLVASTTVSPLFLSVAAY